MVATLHYYYDPLCGWCYAAAPLVGAAAALPDITLQMHASGMMMGAQRQPVSPALRQYVMPHDQRIHAMTGQPFGTHYFEGLLRDTSAVLDSAPPISAVLVAEALGKAPLTMLHLLQRAHYAEGRRIADTDVLVSLGEELGLDAAAFSAELQRQAARAVTHVDQSRREMAQLGLRGFPALVLEQDGKRVPVDVSGFLGKPEAFVAHLREMSGVSEPIVADAASFCTPETCAPPAAR
jgi:putative protein-disulfide isomerase